MKKQEIVELMTNVEFQLEFVESASDLGIYTRLPIDKIVSLGVAFESLQSAFQTVLSSGHATSGIYRVTVPQGAILAAAKDGSGFLGSAIQEGKGLVGQARLHPLVCDPTMIFMAITLMSIEKKLDSIEEIQLEILEFLRQKDKAKLRGSLVYLSDVLNNFKYNWNNQKYCDGNYKKILDIKHEAEQDIIFSRGRIQGRLKKKSIFQTDQDVRTLLGKYQTEFEDYQLSVYLFAMTSFLEIMLIENFESDFLDKMIEKIDSYSYDYRALYTECYNRLERDFGKSIEALVAKGASNAGKVLGHVVEKVPALNNIGVDAALQKAGDELSQRDFRKRKKYLSRLTDQQSCYVGPFVDNIRMVKQVYNNSLELAFDKQSLYVITGGEKNAKDKK